MPLLKVWSANRKIKKFIFLEILSMQNLHEIVSQKFYLISPIKFVLESDGTEIEDDDALQAVFNEIIMVLEAGESWTAISLVQEPAMQVDLDTNNSLVGTKKSENTNVNKRLYIPWEKLPTQIAFKLTDKKKLISSETSALVNVVVNSIREKTNFPGRPLLKEYAKTMVETYATLLDTDDDGVVIGNGYTSLFKKIEDRNNYLNRPFNSEENNANSANIRKRKRVPGYYKAGCSHWQPDHHPEDENEVSLKEKQDFLKDIAHSESIDQNHKMLIETYLEKTFPTQRLFFNSVPQPTIQSIREEWPILLNPEYTIWHYNYLMGSESNIVQTFSDAKIKIEKTYYYFQFKHKNVVEENESNISISLQTYQYIASYFKEDFSLIYKDVTQKCTLDELLEDCPLTPCIVTTDNIMYLIAEKSVVSSTFKNFDHAFVQLYALYFMCNMEYPRKCCATMEFIQRYFIKYHPETGSKISKKSKVCNTLTSVINLINKITLFKYPRATSN